jgi:hypothetical protein
MAIEIKRTWETVEFESTNLHTGYFAKVTLTLNREKKTFQIQQPHEEGIRFDKDCIEQAEQRLKAVNAAFKYAQQELK